MNRVGLNLNLARFVLNHDEGVSARELANLARWERNLLKIGR